MSNISCWSEVGQSWDWFSMQLWFILVVAGLFTSLVIGGNCLVVVAVASLRTLHTTTNFLIVSLALSDLSLGVLILPFSVFLLLTNQVWPFGYVWCQMYLAIDVWLSTASIYNLLAISFDRYMALARPLKYKLIASTNICRLLVCLAYIIPLAVALPPIIIAYFSPNDDKNIGFHDNRNDNSTIYMSHSECKCTPMDNTTAYVIYSALSSFFLPLFLIIALNAGIYQKARRISRSNKLVAAQRKKEKEAAVHNMASNTQHLTGIASLASLLSGKRIKMSKKKEPDELRIHRGKFNADNTRTKHSGKSNHGGKSQSEVKSLSSTDIASNKSISRRISTCSSTIIRGTPNYPKGRISSVSERRVGGRLYGPLDQTLSPIITMKKKASMDSMCNVNSNPRRTMQQLQLQAQQLNKKKKRASQAAETRVAKTVGIVISCFIICWLPFSIIYFVQAFIESKIADMFPVLFEISFWLGYSNSALNPIIYASFSRDFRKAFKRTLGRCLFHKYDIANEGLMGIAKRMNRSDIDHFGNEGSNFSLSQSCAGKASGSISYHR